MRGERDVNVTNNVKVSDRSGNMVGFQGTDHYDASSLFSDTVDLPTPGYIYIPAAGDAALMLFNSDTALTYTFEQAGLYPLVVKRIMSTGTTVTNAYIIH